jgi:hypothetical protein
MRTQASRDADFLTSITDPPLSRSQVIRLSNWRSVPAVSIYLPSPIKGPDVNQGPKPQKKHFAETQERLGAGMRPTLARELLHPAESLVHHSPFWRDRAAAIAVFVAPDFFRAFRLPFQVDERLVVGTSFHVRPLLAELRGCQAFNVLSLDRNNVRLVHCRPSSAKEVHVEGMPHSFEALFALDYSEKQMQAHTAGPPGMAGSVISHGAGDQGIDDKDRPRRFCVAIDHAILPYLNQEKHPLILAGTAEAQEAYRSIARYPFLLPTGVTRAPKVLSNAELARLARPVADNYDERPRRQAIDLYAQMAGTGRTSQQIEEILLAASAGRVVALLVPPGAPVWGWYDPHARLVIVHEECQAGDEDLINRAVVETLVHGGQTFELDSGDLPLEGPVGAIFRY